MDKNLDTLMFALARNSLETSITHGLAFIFDKQEEICKNFLTQATGDNISEVYEVKAEKTANIDGNNVQSDLRICAIDAIGKEKTFFVENKCSTLSNESQAIRYFSLINEERKVIFTSPFSDVLQHDILGYLEKESTPAGMHFFSYSSIAAIFSKAKGGTEEFGELLSGIERDLSGMDDWREWYARQGLTVDQAKQTPKQRKELDAWDAKLAVIRYKLSGQKMLAEIMEYFKDEICAKRTKLSFSNNSPTITIPFFPSSKKDTTEFGVQIDGMQYRRYVRNKIINKYFERKNENGGNDSNKDPILPRNDQPSDKQFVKAVRNWFGKDSHDPKRWCCGFDFKDGKSPFIYLYDDLPIVTGAHGREEIDMDDVFISIKKDIVRSVDGEFSCLKP